MGKTSIEWTDATWNPVVGCSVVSPGCTNCYAMAMAARLEKMMNPDLRGDVVLPHHYTSLTQPSKAGPVWTGRVNITPDHILTAPLRWHKSRKVFVNSMGDLFHESVPDEWIDRVFAVMALCPQHTFQALTKRAMRMRDYCKRLVARNEVELAAERIRPSKDLPVSPKWCFAWPLPNVWLGVSCEDQERADERIPHLLATPAAVRFVSCEPLLGPIDLENLRRYNPQGSPWINALHGFVTHGDYLARGPHESCFNKRTRVTPPELPALNQVIVGGESGPNARPMHPDWARSLRDQCNAAGVPFFMKQMTKKAEIPADLLIREWPHAA